MDSPINPFRRDTAARWRSRFGTLRAAALVTTLATTLVGCGGDDSEDTPGPSLTQAVPTAQQIARAQTTLDGTVAANDSIAAKQVALDADADKAPD